MSVAFEGHGPWCKFVEYQMSNVEYQANFTHVESGQKKNSEQCALHLAE